MHELEESKQESHNRNGTFRLLPWVLGREGTVGPERKQALRTRVRSGDKWPEPGCIVKPESRVNLPFYLVPRPAKGPPGHSSHNCLKSKHILAARERLLNDPQDARHNWT